MKQRGRPVLRYHGGKWILAPWIIGFFPKHRIYVEPFGGGASVLIRKPRSYAEVYNDLDDEIVNVFRILRDSRQAEELARLISLTPWSRTEFYAAYEPTEDPLERARRTIARAYMAFGTTSRRANRTGFRVRCYRQHTTAPRDWVRYPAAIAAFCERLKGVAIENRDALMVMAQQDSPETLHYLDPPYPRSTRPSQKWDSRNDRAYAHEMTDDDHRELARIAHQLDGFVMISGYPCELYDRELYHDWQRHERGHLADGAQKRTEVLWLNPACVSALRGEDRQQKLFEVPA
jgi:DNA adenine methylase